MKRLILASVLLTGCEMLVPNGGKKPNPQPEAPPLPTQRLEIVLKFDNEGRIKVDGDGTINVRNADSECQCGCGKTGCKCETRDLTGNGSTSVRTGEKVGTAANDRRRAGEVLLSQRNVVTVISPASFRCEACELAVSSLRALGVDVRQEKSDGYSVYPIIKNAKGKEYKLPDGFWRVGRDDIAVANQLAE
jgi:hypothetical protein